jgi:hypothetical protein
MAFVSQQPNSLNDSNDTNGIMELDICILFMEEDEMEDNNVPWIIKPNTDDVQFITAEERFISSPIQVTAIRNDNNNNNNNFAINTATMGTHHNSTDQPILRRYANPEGIVHISIDPKRPTSDTMTRTKTTTQNNLLYYRIHHEESGCEIHIQSPTTTFIKNDNNIVGKNRARDIHLVDTTTKGFFFSQSDHDDDDESEHSEDNDSFIAPSDDDDDDNDDDTEDACRICHDGGHMIVCDGGDQLISSCGNMFHLECINRTVVPPGDWICKDCTNQNLHAIHGLDHEVGIEGYEFRQSNATNADSELVKSNRKRMYKQGILDLSSDNEYFEQHGSSPETTHISNQKEKENDKVRSHYKNDGDMNTTELSLEETRIGKRQCIIDSDDE